MYFPLLEVLKGSEDFNQIDITLFDAVLFAIHQKGYYKRFNPGVYRYFDVQINEEKWIKALDKLSQAELLTKTYELCSPLSSETIEIYNKLDEIPLGSYRSVLEDNEEFEVTEKDIFVTYSFNDLFVPQSFDSMEGSNRDFFRLKSLNEVQTNGLSMSIDSSTTKSSEIKLVSLETLMIHHPGLVIDGCVDQNRQLLRKCLYEAESSSKSSDKGNTLESLTKNLLSSPYLQFLGEKIRTSTGEVDVAFKVRKYQTTIFGSFSDLLITECKNWKSNVGSSEVRSFADKMEEADCKVGIILSRKGVTGKEDHMRDAKGLIRDKWRSNKLIIIVLDFNDINFIIDDKYSLYKSLEDKYYGVKML